MADFLIRKIPGATLRQAKKMAAQHHRSLQEELSNLLIETIHFRAGTWSKTADLIRSGTASSGRRHSDSADLLRQDRNR